MKEKSSTLSASVGKILKANWKGAKKIVILIAIIALVCTMVLWKLNQPAHEIDITTISTLEKIVNISELSTYTTQYNGIAQATSEADPDEIEYYVSYQSTLKAGIDFNKIDFQVNETEKTITATIPEVYFTDISVDIGSLDYIFIDDKLNQSTVSAQALTLCEEDVTRESKEQEAMIELARQNAINMVTALIDPILAQTKPDYTLQVV